MKRIKVRLGKRSYDIIIGSGLLKAAGGEIEKIRIGKDALVITNKRLLGLYRKGLENSLKRNGFSVRFELVPDSEKAKSIGVVTTLLNRISAYDVRKELFIIAFGGGVVGDVAGFVASVYKRGIPYVQIPTTLVAQVDSSIGGKVAIDLSVAKNLAGAFYQPRLVLSDISLIKSLPPRQLKNGLAEVIKYGVIKDVRLFKFLAANRKKILRGDPRALEFVISRCARIKAGVVSRDEFDKKGVRATLNFGHTIGHAIEAASGYSKCYNHGEAVAIGMVVASRISARLGYMKVSGADKIEELIKKTGLPTAAKGVRPSDVYRSHLHDKKFIRGRNRFILPTKIGAVRQVEGVSDSVIVNVLKNRCSAR